MLGGAKGIFNFGKLDVGIPQDFWVLFVPVGAQDVASSGVPSPRIPFFVFVYMNSKAVVVLRDSNGEERCSAAVSFQKTAYVPFHLLFIPYFPCVSLFGQLREPL